MKTSWISVREVLLAVKLTLLSIVVVQKQALRLVPSDFANVHLMNIKYSEETHGKLSGFTI